MQHDAAYRRDSRVAAEKRDRTAILLRQEEFAEGAVDGHRCAGSELFQRNTTFPGADTHAELNRLRQLWRRGDRVCARDALRKSKVDPLPRLELKIVLRECHRQLQYCGCELLDLGDGRGMVAHHHIPAFASF